MQCDYIHWLPLTDYYYCSQVINQELLRCYTLNNIILFKCSIAIH